MVGHVGKKASKTEKSREKKDPYLNECVAAAQCHRFIASRFVSFGLLRLRRWLLLFFRKVSDFIR